MKILKIFLYVLPYLPTAINYLLKKFNLKKITIMEDKIRRVAAVIDDEINFITISKSFKNVLIKSAVASIELFDGTVFKLGLNELIDLVPENKKWIVDKYLDAIIARDWLVVVDTTADVVNVFIDIEGADEEEEKDALAGVLVLMFKFIKSKASRYLR